MVTRAKAPEEIQNLSSRLMTQFTAQPSGLRATPGPIPGTVPRPLARGELAAAPLPRPAPAPTATPASVSAMWRGLPEPQRDVAATRLEATYPGARPSPTEVATFLSGEGLRLSGRGQEMLTGAAAPQQQGFRPAGPAPIGPEPPPTPATVAPQEVAPEFTGVHAQRGAGGFEVPSEFGTLEEARGFRQFREEMTQSDQANVAKVLQRDPETGKYWTQEFMQGGLGPPAMEKPLSRKLFDGTEAEFATANEAITARNLQRMQGFGLQGAQQTGAAGTRKDVAQAELFGAQAEAVPVTATSAAGLRQAQAEAAGTAKLLRFTEEVPTFDKLGETGTPRRVQKFFDPTTRTVIDPLSGDAQRPTMATAAAARSALPEAKQSIVDKHFADKRLSAEEVMSFISTLE